MIALPFLNDFLVYLKRTLPTSVSSYKSYITKAVQSLLQDLQYDLAQAISTVQTCSEWDRVKDVTLMKCDQLEGIEPKVIGNWKSALRKYFIYLDSQLQLIDDKIDEEKEDTENDTSTPETIQQPKTKKKNTQVDDDNYITHDEIYKVIKSRLGTDDRFQRDSMYIPMRQIKSILKSSPDFKAKYEEWENDLIENTILITERGAVHLRNITGISIARPYVFVHFKLSGAERVRLFTYTKEGGRIVPFTTYKVDGKTGMAVNLDKAEIIGNMSREHFPECSLIALSSVNPFKALPKITTICKKYGITNGSKLQDAMSHNPNFNANISNAVSVQDLYDDICLIKEYQSVTIMASSANIGKGGTKTKSVKSGRIPNSSITII